MHTMLAITMFRAKVLIVTMLHAKFKISNPELQNVFL